MKRAALDGVELEYEVYGDGEPVVLIHPGIFADWFDPLIREGALAGRHALLHYHRAGCAGSSHLTGPVSVADHATHSRLLMKHLGIARAHVVGHSSSGNVALQLALDAPECVQSLAVLEPALMTVPSVVTSRVAIGEAVQCYKASDKARAIDTFLKCVCGPEYRAALDRALPGGFEQYVTDAPTFFEQEFPALQQWAFGRDAGVAYDTRCSPSSASAVWCTTRSGASGINCCSTGCRTWSRSCCPGRRICCRLRTPPVWRRVWRAFLPVMAPSLRSEYHLRAVSRGRS